MFVFLVRLRFCRIVCEHLPFATSPCRPRLAPRAPTACLHDCKSFILGETYACQLMSRASSVLVAMSSRCAAALPPPLRAELQAHGRTSRFTLCTVVQVVDIATGVVKHTFPGDTEPLTAIAVSSNGKHVFSASRSLTSKAWDLTTGTCFRSWKV